MPLSYQEILERRRALRLPGYKTFAEMGFDEWITPYHISSRSMDGPVLVAFHWLDGPTIDAHRPTLSRLGYLPTIRFNQVLDRSLCLSGLGRGALYVTQAFQLVPARRSQPISARHVDASFDQVTRHELVGRRVIALGGVAAAVCKRHGVFSDTLIVTCHPSRRGYSNDANASEIANALRVAVRVES